MRDANKPTGIPNEQVVYTQYDERVPAAESRSRSSKKKMMKREKKEGRESSVCDRVNHSEEAAGGKAEMQKQKRS